MYENFELLPFYLSVGSVWMETFLLLLSIWSFYIIYQPSLCHEISGLRFPARTYAQWHVRVFLHLWEMPSLLEMWEMTAPGCSCAASHAVLPALTLSVGLSLSVAHGP